MVPDEAAEDADGAFVNARPVTKKFRPFVLLSGIMRQVELTVKAYADINAVGLFCLQKAAPSGK